MDRDQPSSTALSSLATTPALSHHGSLALSEFPLVPMSGSGVGTENVGNDSHPTTSDNTHEMLASNLAPIDGGRQAWTFLIGCFAIEALVFGYSFSFGTYQNFHLNDPKSPLYGQSTSAIAAIGTVALGMQCFAPILLRGFSRTFPHLVLPMGLGASVVGALAMLATSFVRSTEPILALQTVYGLCTGAAFLPVLLYLSQWWSTRRGMATGIIFAGTGLGGVVFPQLIASMLAHIGFAWTVRVMSLITMLGLTAASLCLRPRLPIPAAVRQTRRRWDRHLVRALLPGTLRGMLSPLAGLNEMAIVVQSCAWYTISLFIASYCTSLGFSSTTANAVLSAFNAAAVLGYLVTGLMIDRLAYTAIMCASMLICAVSVFLLMGFSQSLPMVLAFVLIFGLAGGGFTTFFSPVARDAAAMSDQDSATILLGIVFLRGAASLVGPLIGSALYNSKRTAAANQTFRLYGTHGFRGIVLFVGGSMLAGSLLSAAATWQRNRDLLRAGDAIRERWQSQ